MPIFTVDLYFNYGKNMYGKLLLRVIPILLIFLAGCSSSDQTTLTSSLSQQSTALYETGFDTIKAQKFDTGKMWTFDNPPLDYFEEEYGFRPDEQWLSDVRMSALKFANWCSASFISEDGLIMTNNHCSDFIVSDLNEEGEDIRSTGFIASMLEDERKHPTLYVDQLISIKDVTAEVQSAIDAGSSPEEKTKNKKDKIASLEKKEGDKVSKVISLYSGGKYSLYEYKRYSDIRLVLMPESELGLYGGDPDNYTYPRYSLDCTFWRAYEDGKPAKIQNFFKWSVDGAKEDEPLFVIGNPGNTNKLKTTAQLKYMRDYTYLNNAYIFIELQKIYEELIEEFPERRQELVDNLSNYANVAKRYSGVLRGLKNNSYMARKEDFEKSFKAAVMADPELKKKYGSVWENIESTRNEMRQYGNEIYAYTRIRSAISGYFQIAIKLAELADALSMPEEQRAVQYQKENIDSTIQAIWPDDFDKAVAKKKLRVHAGLMYMNLGEDNELVKDLWGGKKGAEAAEYAVSNSKINSKNDVTALAEKGADAIYNSGDPFINFILKTKDRYNHIQKMVAEINTTESVYDNLLGQALFEVYGTSIPPDGTGTLRIGDGVLKSYDYNGTIAPLFTTFYGMYDRYYSFNKEFPWSLPERWANPPAEFDLETKYNFISTHDIVGGSSGSPVINKNKEIVGIAFDGNIESNAGYFIYDTKENRMISVASQGMLEVVQDVYQLKRLSEEMKHGRITD